MRIMSIRINIVHGIVEGVAITIKALWISGVWYNGVGRNHAVRV
jgi:hypothetical protein